MAGPACRCSSLARAPSLARAAIPCSTMRPAVPRQPEWRRATAPEGWAMNTGTQSAMVTAIPVPRSRLAWPSAAGTRSHPSQPRAWSTTRLPCTCVAVAKRGPRGRSSSCSRAQRAVTSPTGSLPWVPKLPAARVVVNARTPNAAKSSMGSCGVAGAAAASPAAPAAPAAPASGVLVIHPLDVRAEGAEPLVNPLVAALDLPDVLDLALAGGAEGGEEHGHAGADVGRLDGGAAKLDRAGDDGPMGVAEHDPRAHADQLVHEEHARLEHLLVHEHHAAALGRRDDGDGHHVGREGGPGLVREGRHVSAQVALDLAALLRRDDEVLPLDAAGDAQPLEAHQGRAEVFDAGALDAQLRAGDGGEADEGADLDVVRADAVRGAAQRAAALDGEGVGADAVDARAEGTEEVREVLDV